MIGQAVLPSICSLKWTKEEPSLIGLHELGISLSEQILFAYFDESSFSTFG